MLCKLVFYLVIVPLSWLPVSRTTALYQRWHSKCWPKESLLFVGLRDEAYRVALQKGYLLRAWESQIMVFRTFKEEETVIADHEDLIERWRLAGRWLREAE